MEGTDGGAREGFWGEPGGIQVSLGNLEGTWRRFQGAPGAFPKNPGTPGRTREALGGPERPLEDPAPLYDPRAPPLRALASMVSAPAHSGNDVTTQRRRK